MVCSTIVFMCVPCQQFPHANVDLILSKLKGPVGSQADAIQEAFRKADIHNTGKLGFHTFTSLVLQMAKGLLNQHEIMTLGRHFGDKKVSMPANMSL